MDLSERIERIARRAQAHIADGAFSGIEWQIMRGGKLWTKGRAGMADAIKGQEMADIPIYRIYSMTKPIISAVAVMLMEEGKLRLMDPVARFIPAFAKAKVCDGEGGLRNSGGLMLIEHLLTHRAGLSYGFLADCPAGARYKASGLIGKFHSLQAFVDGIAEQPLAFDPGTDWRYSVATDVMARIIEIVEGEPLGRVLAKRVFEPLGLKDTDFFVPQAERHRIMPMFGQGNLDRIMEFPPGMQKLAHAEGDYASPCDDPTFARGGHGLFSTLPDYTIIAQFLSSGLTANGDRLLSRKGIDSLWTNRISPNLLPLRIGPIPLLGYGYGLAGRVLIDPGLMLGFSSLGECGWAGAASTYFWIDKSEDIIGIVMTQYLGSTLPLADDIRNAVYQALD